VANRPAWSAVAAAGAGLAGWGLFESQWVATRSLEVPVAALPPALDGLSVLHLSDFHAGTPSLNIRSMRKAIRFGEAVRPDLVAITGDLISHPRALPSVARELARLTPPLGMFAVTGNHEVGATNDPFSRGVVVDDWSPAPVHLLRDEMQAAERDGMRIEIAGLDAASEIAGRAPDPAALFERPDAFRILLSHFPDAAERVAPGACSLVLSGHLHGGQICVPTPRGKLRLSHGQWRFPEGVFQEGETTIVVSRGTGTTLVPFRFLARPEVCLLRLCPA
jgi:hypothetical protein